MGASLGKLATDNYYPDSLAENVRQFVGHKRKYDDSDDEESGTAKRKKLPSTPKYIHKTLFTEGKGSDVTVEALGKQWKLHKIYLSQSPYFASMFSGAWKEAEEDTVKIEIVDPKITIGALHTVFSSLYMDETVLEPAEIVTVVAASTLFQLEGIIEKCTEVMLETMSPKTAVTYYEASCEYGLKSVKENSFKFIQVSLLSRITEFSDQMKSMSVDLMTKLIKSQDLFVISSELSLYLFMRKWLYLQLDIPDDPEVPEGVPAPCHYFKNVRRGLMPFLLTDEGKKYVEAFRSLKLQHIITHHADLGIIASDNIIPPNWFMPFFRIQWSNILRINQGVETGPERVELADFWQGSMRLGRVIPQANNMWRWMDFNNGLDLIWSCTDAAIKLKRAHDVDSTFLLSQIPKRTIVIRIRVACFSADGKTVTTQSSGVKPITLFKNEEVVAMPLNKKLKFPLMVAVNLLSVKYTPVAPPQLPIDKSTQCPEVTTETAVTEQDTIENLTTETAVLKQDTIENLTSVNLEHLFSSSSSSSVVTK